MKKRLKGNTYIEDGHYNFTAFLHLGADGEIRMTKTSSGSYSHERMCKVNIRVPEAAFKEPEFTVDIDFKGASVSDINRAEIVEDIQEKLHDMPLIVRVAPKEPES